MITTRSNIMTKKKMLNLFSLLADCASRLQHKAINYLTHASLKLRMYYYNIYLFYCVNRIKIFASFSTNNNHNNQTSLYITYLFNKYSLTGISDN